MRKSMIFAAAGCIAMGSVLLSACSSEVTVPSVIQVQNLDDAEGQITLTTSETVKVVPDMAQIIYRITTEHEDAAQCQQDNTEKLNALLEYLKGEGFEDKSIQTSDFSLDARYDWNSGRQNIIGYEMSTQVTVSDIPMDQVGAMLTKGVESGANEIYSVSYYASNYDEAYEEALTKALALAKAKAEALAAADGQIVGRVTDIQEYGDNQYGRYVSSGIAVTRDAVAVKEAASADMGVMPGELEVSATISVTFALGN